MRRIACISQPNIDYDILWKVQSTLNNKLTLHGKTLKDYIADLKDVFRNDNVCTHLFFSFIVAATSQTLLELLSSSPLSISYKLNPDSGTLAIVSGSLENWKQLVINHATSNSSSEARLVVNELQLYFEQNLELYEIFKDHRKKSNKDGTFLLEEIK